MKTISLIFIFFFGLFNLSKLHSQGLDSLQSVYATSPQDYELGGIKVLGAVYSDEKAIIAISGLEVGQKVRIPGLATQKAVKALMKLKLFKEVNLAIEKKLGDVIFFEIQVEESLRLADFSIKGIKKHQKEELENIILCHLTKGGILNNHNKSNAIDGIKGYFLEKGYAEVKIDLEENPSSKLANSSFLVFNVQKGKKVKVLGIHFFGNDKVSSKKLKKLSGIKTKEQLFASSKLDQKELKLGKNSIIQYYHTLGFLDAKIQAEKLIKSRDGHWILHIDIQEGIQYYFGDISWKGNSKYDSKDLDNFLGIQKGDLYNAEKLESRLKFSWDGSDVSSLYLDDGYLFFQLDVIQKSIRQDTIDLQIKILEGAQANVGKVIIKGNSKTNEEVIRRELHTEPGKKFSRADIIRSQRAIAGLGYFNPEKINILTPVDAKNQTVDIVYELEEQSSDQFELSGAWAGGDVGFTGSLGVTFNNFSFKNIFNKEAWSPVPSGDGQSLSLRFQSNGLQYQSYNFSFTEPWLGGKKPQSFSVTGFYNHYGGSENVETGIRPAFNILGLTTSLGRRLNFPDNNFVSTTAINFQKYFLREWDSGLFKTDLGETVSNGEFYNISLNQTIARNTVDNPFFPSSGSGLSLSMQLTLPYTLFNNKNYSNLTPQDRYKFLEYHKWNFDAEWYTKIAGDLVVKTYGKLGFLGAYNKSLGLSPFERFRMGGNGMNVIQQGFTGTDPIALRGYEVTDLENNFVNGVESATSVFNKFGFELRYPVIKNGSFPVYLLAFAEGGNAWQSINDYNPFDLKRSVGLGFRAQVPMLGLMGLDVGLGLDKPGTKTFKDMLQFSFILGFEPK